jgi:hypothetical protein
MIRSLTSWFGLDVELEGERLLLARATPGEQIAASEICVLPIRDAILPDVPTKNTTLDGLKELLNRSARLPSLPLRPPSDSGSSGYEGRLSVRDLIAFNFLPQHIVANPYTLFYKADTTEHRETLRHLFPYVLGVMGADDLRLAHQLALARTLLREKERQLEERRRARDAWDTDILALHIRARDLSLIPQIEPESIEQALIQLRMLPQHSLPEYELGTADAIVSGLEKLREEDYGLDREIGARKRRLARIRQLQAAVRGLTHTLEEQSSFLDRAGWFGKHIGRGVECPLCGQTGHAAEEELGQVQALAESLATEIDAGGSSFFPLDQSEARALNEMREYEAQLRRVRAQRNELEQNIAEQSGQRQRLESVYRFIGRLEEGLANVERSSEFSELAGEVQTIRNTVAELQRRLDPQARADKLEVVTRTVGRAIGHFATHLGLERAEDVIELETKQLTLRFLSDVRKDYLWEIGSGRNWMGYHIATALALHQHFSSLPHTPVPRFLVVDQPSQVFYPEDYHPGSEVNLTEDEKMTRQIFETLSTALEQIEGGFQVIVLEHAGPRVWGGLDAVNLVITWRAEDDDYLIPLAWQQAAAEAEG